MSTNVTAAQKYQRRHDRRTLTNFARQPIEREKDCLVVPAGMRAVDMTELVARRRIGPVSDNGLSLGLLLGCLQLGAAKRRKAVFG